MFANKQYLIKLTKLIHKFPNVKITFISSAELLKKYIFPKEIHTENYDKLMHYRKHYSNENTI